MDTLTPFLKIGLLMLLAVATPGPDFAIVARNTLLHSRRIGIFTALGVSCANWVHITYCLLGLGVVITQSLWLFRVIKYLGAIYLVYLGIVLWRSKTESVSYPTPAVPSDRLALSAIQAFYQGFLCNMLNVKAALFFLGLFTLVIRPEISSWQKGLYGLELIAIAATWFCSLTVLLSHPRVAFALKNIQARLMKILGVFLASFGVSLALLGRG